MCAFIAAALFVTMFLLANIPGQPIVDVDLVGDGAFGFDCYIQSVVHGWPFCFLRHDGYYPGPFKNGPSPWHVGSNAQLAPTAFVANAAILLIGTFAVARSVQRRLQKHHWQFSIVDVIVATCVVCVVAAFISQRLRLHRAQVEWTNASLRQGDDEYQEVWQPFGPYWLRRITGPQAWSWGDRLVAADVFCPEDIAVLPGPRRIRLLRVNAVNLDSVPSFAAYGRLVAISFAQASWWRNYDIVDFENADLSALLTAIAQCQSLEGLNLCGSPIKDNELVYLSTMTNLRDLDLERTSISNEGLVHLAGIRSLRKLVLSDTQVTQDGIERLRAQLADCQIRWMGWNVQETGSVVHPSAVKTDPPLENGLQQ